jgi:hypothetical protein
VPDLGVPDLAMEEMPSDSLDIADFATEAMEDLDLGSPSDSLELDSIEEMQGLEEIEDMEPLSDLADFSDDSFSEDSFSDTSAPDDQDLDLGDGLDALADMATTEEPQTFEEWEGIVPPGRASLSVPDVEEIDSSEWAIDESPSLSAGLEDLDDNWDDSDLDDMALSPEEMETSQPIHFDREEPLVGDAMGLADLDAMDSLFQNSDDNFDDQDSAGLAELDPFLDLEDPFDEVDESEEDPFASLDEDAPMFPPPPPRPGR